MLVTDEIRHLISLLEKQPETANQNLPVLLQKLQQRCNRPEIQDFYANLPNTPTEIGSYPIDAEGYAIAYSPLEDEVAFLEAWRKYGLVVGKQVAPPALCEAARARIHGLVNAISEGKCDLTNPATWENIPKDSNSTPIISRGFFEVYHDAILADLRQSLRLFLHHVVLWGNADLWTSFDRLGVKLPGHEESKALPLHVDQNPNVHPNFRTLQGVLAITDCPAERGTFVGVPGSRGHFPAYGTMAKNMGEHVELDLAHPIAQTLVAHAQPIPLRAGDIVTWDSRTTHANSNNISSQSRMVAYIAAGPAPDDPSLRQTRRNAYESGEGSNVRDALMHASKKPRYSNPEALQKARQPEVLTVLGEHLYGFKKSEQE